MNKVSKQLFRLFNESYLLDYFKMVDKAKEYEDLQNRLCDYLYAELMSSDMYKRYLMLDIKDDIKIDIPEELKKIGICNITFMEDGFEILYKIYSLNKDPDLIYDTLSSFVSNISVEKHNICNIFMFQDVDISLDEFYYDTYLLFGSQHISFDSQATVKVKSGPFLILDYSKMTSTWNYDFAPFYHLDTDKNTILVYLDSNSDFFDSVYGLHISDNKSEKILYYYAVVGKENIFYVLNILLETNTKGTFNLLFGCNLKDIGLSKLEWLKLKDIVRKLTKKSINVCFLDTLAK